MSALRLMTFNVQLPSLAMAVGQGQDNKAKARASEVAASILNRPLRDRPDVMAFNEVFNEDARNTLLSKLGVVYSHLIKKLDEGGVDEDSGLMLVRRFPFLTLANGDDHAVFEHEAVPAGSSGGAACGAGGVMPWGRGGGEGREGAEGVRVHYALADQAPVGLPRPPALSIRHGPLSRGGAEGDVPRHRSHGSLSPLRLRTS